MTQEEKQLATVSPAMGIVDLKSTITTIKDLVKKGMHDGYDYGVIPGTGNKKTLLQPGAEKLSKFFGLTPKYTLLKEIEDFKGGFIYYKYKCELVHFKTGNHAGETERSSNNKEKAFSRDSIFDVANKVQAKAQKRAFVAAVRNATMASEIFFEGADSEDNEDAPGKPVTQEEDPGRIALLRKFFAAAKERGYDEEKIKSMLKAKFKVDSVTKISNAQIKGAYENLITRPLTKEADNQKKLDEFDTMAKEAQTKEKVEEGQIVEEKKYCYECGKETKNETWFCTLDHKKLYWSKKDPNNFAKMERQGIFKTL